MMQTKIITEKDVNKVFIDFINLVMGWETEENRVLIETKTGPRPHQSLYFTLWWRSIYFLKQNEGRIIPPENPDKTLPAVQYLRGEAQCGIYITARGPEAFGAALRVRQALDSAQRWCDLWRILGFGGTDEIHDESAEYNSRIQPRAFFELQFNANFGAEYPVDWFDASQWDINNSNFIFPKEFPPCPQAR